MAHMRKGTKTQEQLQKLSDDIIAAWNRAIVEPHAPEGREEMRKWKLHSVLILPIDIVGSEAGLIPPPPGQEAAWASKHVADIQRRADEGNESMAETIDEFKGERCTVGAADTVGLTVASTEYVSESEPKSWLSLQDGHSFRLLPIHHQEVHRHAPTSRQDKHLQSSRHPQARRIVRRLAFEEDRRSDDTTNRAETNLQRRANSSLRLFADVVCLVGQYGWNITLTACLAEENTAIAHHVVGGVGGPAVM